MGHVADIESKTQLDQAVDKLIELTMAPVDRHTPLSRPCPYSKRWFTPMLKIQQREANRARRRWQGSCVRKGKEDPSTFRLLEEMRTRRREWTRAIERAKATHWKEFLDKASYKTLWKATTCLGPRDNYTRIPPLKIGETEFPETKIKLVT